MLKNIAFYSFSVVSVSSVVNSLSRREAVMKLFKQFGSVIAVLTLIYGDAFAAGPPPIDRPSPPACCADGMCYPNPTTWGFYGTRWRRWPTTQLEPTPADAQPPGTRRLKFRPLSGRPLKMKNRPRRRRHARPKKLAKRMKRTAGRKRAAYNVAVWNASGQRYPTGSAFAAG